MSTPLQKWLVSVALALGLLWQSGGSEASGEPGYDHPAYWLGLVRPLEMPAPDRPLTPAEYRETLREAENAADRLAKRYGMLHPALAPATNRLARLCARQQDYARATVYHRRSLRIWEQALGKSDPALVAPVQDLAEIRKLQGNTDRARALQFRALELLGMKADMPIEDFAQHVREDLRKPDKGRARKVFEFVDKALDYGAAMGGDASYLEERRDEAKERADYLTRVATSVEAIATHKTELGDYRGAERLLRSVLELREEILGVEHPDVAASLESLATFYGDILGDHGELERFLQRAVDIREKSAGNPEDPGKFRRLLNWAFGADEERLRAFEGVLDQLAEYYQEQGRYADAGALYERSLAVRGKLLGPDHPDLGISLDKLGASLRDQGAFAEAEEHHLRALALRENAAYTEEVNEQLEEAIRYLERVQDEFKKAKDKYGEFITGDESGTVTFALDYYGCEDEDGLHDRLKSEAEGAAAERRYWGIRSSLLTLGETYRVQGKMSDAEAQYRRALELSEVHLGEVHPYVCNDLIHLAEVSAGQGRHAQADSLLQRGMNLLEASDMAMGTLALKMRKHRGQIALDQGNTDAATVYYSRALETAEALYGEDHWNVAASLYDLARLHTAVARPDESLPLLLRALQIEDGSIEGVFSFASERNKLAFLKKLTPSYELLKALTAGPLGDGTAAEACFDAVLRRKGLVLEVLSRERERLSRVDDPKVAETAARLRAVAARLAGMQLSMAQRTQFDNAFRKDVDQLLKEKERLEADLARQSASFTEDQEQKSVAGRELAARLETGSALVEYVGYRRTILNPSDSGGAPDSYMAFVLRPESAPVLKDLGDSRTINQAVAEVRRKLVQALDTIARVGEPEAERQFQGSAARLYDLVYRPVEEMLGGAERVLLAPDGDLNLIPFAVLSDREGGYLAQRYRFTYLSSGRDLLHHGSDSPAGESVVVIADPDYDLVPVDRIAPADSAGEGDLFVATRASEVRFGDLSQVEWPPLAGTRREAEAIAQLVADRPVEMHLGQEATETTAKGVHSPGVLHLATHGFFLQEEQESGTASGSRGAFVSAAASAPAAAAEAPRLTIENPLIRCGLVLAGGNRLGKEAAPTCMDDGILTGLEISGMDLRGTDLVVLSACETGLGEVQTGEGVFGLRRAFQLAGARTVVMSLWQVPDAETAELMEHLYRERQNGVGKAEALRAGSLKVMKNRQAAIGAAHPYYWGAFVSVGEW